MLVWIEEAADCSPRAGMVYTSQQIGGAIRTPC